MNRTGQVNSGHLILLSIVGIPVTALLAATWLWYFVVHGDLDLIGILGTANRGSLIQPPRALNEGGLTAVSGTTLIYTDLPAKWAFLIPGSDRCEAVCQQTLYQTRQIHRAMGKESNRIRRIYVSDVPLADSHFDLAGLSDNRPLPESFADFLALEHPGLRTFEVSPEAHTLLFAEYTDSSGVWYLVDPKGWIMMSYTPMQTYKEIMTDLQFLLKNSNE